MRESVRVIKVGIDFGNEVESVGRLTQQDYITFLGTDIELNSGQLEYQKGEEREQEIKRIYEKSLFTQLLDTNEKE